MEVVTTYLLRGRLGSKHGKQRITTSGSKLLFMTNKHITKGHQKIRVHFVFDVNGHFTKKPMETVYSGMFLAEPTNLELWGADAGHAYNFQALTRVKLYTLGVLNVGIINSLRYYIKWVSSLQEQTQIHG